MRRKRNREGKGWYRGIPELKVVDSDAAPVCDLSLSIARENRKGGGEREEVGKQ